MIRWTLLLVGAFLLVSGVSARFDFADAVAPGAPVSLSSALRMRDEGKRRWVSLDVPVDRDHAVYRTGLTRPAFSRAPSSAITPVLDVRNEDELAGFVGSRVEVRLAKAREALVLRASRTGTKASAVHLLVRLAISSPSLWALSPRLPERDAHAQREWSRRDGATGRLSRFRDLTANVRDLEHDPESIRQALRREWSRDVPPDAWVIIADDPASAPQRSMAGEAWLPLRGSANGLFFVDPAGGRLAGSTRIEGVLRSLPAASVPGLEEAIGIPLPPIIGV
ncbi:MAG TPA: hypothetical protein VK116_01880, partial [Planctomycetota bacterium]|nr:hypothetical protein [Planctomycetota bacterium]